MATDKVSILFQRHTKSILPLKRETILIYGAALYVHGNCDPPNGFLLNNNRVSWCRQKT